MEVRYRRTERTVTHRTRIIKWTVTTNTTTNQSAPALTVLPPDGSDGLVVELGGVGLAVVGYDEDSLLMMIFGGRICGFGVQLDQTERRLPARDDWQLDAQIALVGSGRERRENR